MKCRSPNAFIEFIYVSCIEIVVILVSVFTQDAFIACLVHIQQHCDEASKSRFSELFAVADDDSDDEVLLK